MKHAIPLFALALLGCGKDAAPPAPPAPPPATTASVAPAPPREVAHELDAAKHDIPAQPVTGRLGGKPFTPDRIELDGGDLTFRQGSAISPDAQLMVILNKDLPADGPFREVVRAEQKSEERLPFVTGYTSAAGGGLKSEGATQGFALTIEFDKPERNQVTGRIFLSLPGAEKSFIAGRFTAKRDRATNAPPGPDDKPYVTGGIDHKGKDGATLIVGYVRVPTAGVESTYDTVQTTIQPDPIGAVREGKNRPATATVRPGKDNAGVEYDLTKLTPGKYLVAARLDGGVATWFLKDVAADAAVSTPLALKTDATGQVEVDVPGLPEGVLVQVQVLPAEVSADDPTGQFEAHAGLVLGTWENVVKGKATIAKLPPGEYVASARTGDVRYGAKVTVKAGDTAKVELKAAP